MTPCRLLPLIMVLVLGNIAFCDEAAKKAADALQGTWTTEKTIISGKELGTNEETVLGDRLKTAHLSGRQVDSCRYAVLGSPAA